MKAAFLPPGVHPALTGQSFFPTKNNKRPAVKEWRIFADRLPTEAEITSWKNHAGPWAMPCGKIVVLDFDGPEGEALYSELYADTGPPPTATTPKKGLHAYHRPPDNGSGNLLKNAVRIYPGLDIRTTGGYVVTPSAYEDGRTWIVPPSPPLPPVPEKIIELFRKAEVVSAIHASSPNSDGFPLGVEKGQRNATAARLAGRYLAKGLTVEEAAAILILWNRNNNPPLPEQELRSVVFSIARKDREKGPIVEVVSFLDLESRAAATGNMAIAPFLPQGGKGIIAGSGGVGKTLLAMNVAVAVRRDLPVFGRFQSSPGRVLYVDAESTEALTYHRMRKICAGMNVPAGGIDFAFPKGKLDLGTERGRDALSKKIEEVRAAYLFLDSFLCFANIRNENDNVEVRNYLEGLAQITRQTGVTLILLDHAAKASAERAKAGIAVTARGAGSKRDWCDSMLTLEEKKHGARFLRTLRFDKTRFCAPIPGITLEMDPGFVFRASDEDGLCPTFSIRQVVEENPGIGASKLYELLSNKVGCSIRTAMRGVADAVSLGYVRREENSKFVTFYPVSVTNSSVTNIEDSKNEEELPIGYQ